MKIDFQGTVRELDLSDINLKAAMVIQGYTGLSINKFVDVLNDETDDAGEVTLPAVEKPQFLKVVGAVYWLMLQQNGETCPIDAVDFPIGAFSEAIGNAIAAEAQAAEPQPEPEPDPTPPPPVSAPSPVPPSPSSPPALPQPGEPDTGFPHG